MHMKKVVTEIKLPNGQIRRRVQHISEEPSMTQQHMKDQCDVNSILARYQKTGFLNHTVTMPGQYDDFSNYRDFRTSLETVRAAQESFQQLPAQIRARFGNDPAQLIQFISDEKNLDEAVKLGLAVKRAAPSDAQNDDLTTITQATPASPTASAPSAS